MTKYILLDDWIAVSLESFMKKFLTTLNIKKKKK